jgi:hypothetical protein
VRPDSGMEATSSDSLASNLHTHFEADDDSVPATAVPVFASGGHADESFRLHIVPTGSGFRLVGYPFGFSPDGGQPQLMFGYSESADDLVEKLASKLGLPTPQIEAIRRTALEAGTQEIGGSSHSAIRLFSRAVLENIGMSFRPPDC